MPTDHYISTALHLPYKTLQRIEKLAAEYGLSKANMMMRLIERGLMDAGEPIEVSSVSPDGERNKRNIPIMVNNTLRKVL